MLLSFKRQSSEDDRTYGVLFCTCREGHERYFLWCPPRAFSVSIESRGGKGNDFDRECSGRAVQNVSGKNSLRHAKKNGVFQELFTAVTTDYGFQTLTKVEIFIFHQNHLQLVHQLQNPQALHRFSTSLQAPLSQKYPKVQVTRMT